jgi:serine protease Do
MAKNIYILISRSFFNILKDSIIKNFKRKYICRFFFFLTIICCQCRQGKPLKKTVQLKFDENKNNELAKKTSENPNFRIAAKKAMLGVVNIKSTHTINGPSDFLDPHYNDFWFHFFNDNGLTKLKSEGSGVVISSDGYIITSEHVVSEAEDIEIILNDRRSYKAKIIGIDKETDLALLKIKETNLSFMEFGNSDDVEVGDWVLAVGNPFDLTSTVTAGIVSAKARNINIQKTKGAIEAYIQTDAAINAGNSGGALVDYTGKLIGINTAIATVTGGYSGYSFATPINIVKKIINDLLINGKAMRAYLGVVVKDMTAIDSRQLNIDFVTGVYIDSLILGGAAIETDLKLKDIITSIDNRKTETSAQFQEVIERHRPGEIIALTIIRRGKEKQVDVILKEFEGIAPELNPYKALLLGTLGIKIKEVAEKEKKRMKISGGIKVVDVSKGIILKYTNIKSGFVIKKVNGQIVRTEEEFITAFQSSEHIVILEGGYPNFSGIFYYAFGLD